MGLKVSWVSDGRLVGPHVRQALAEGVAQGGAVLLVPSFEQAICAQRELAACAGLSLGVTTSTPQAFARDQWDLWGDGTSLVSASARSVLMSGVVEDAEGEAKAKGQVALSFTPGTVRMLCDIASRALPWVEEDRLGELSGITQGERQSLELVCRYRVRLHERGLREPAEVELVLCDTLERQGVALSPVVYVGFSQMPRAERELLCALAKRTQVVLVMQEDPTPAGDAARSLVDELSRMARRHDVAFESDHLTGQMPSHATGHVAPEGALELSELRARLFVEGADPLVPTGAVRLLEASGPLAEPELVARELAALAEKGATELAVVVPDVPSAWRELTPKLVGRKLRVRATYGIPVLKTQAGQALLSFMRAVARLQELDASWPRPIMGDDGELIRLGDMSWWPPTELSDFLLSDLSHVPLPQARHLDALWRSNRLLCPGAVLEQLMNAKLTSEAVERATRELLRGRLGSAASRLLAPYVESAAGEGESQEEASHAPDTATDSLSRQEAMAVLAAFIGCGGTLKELGISADPEAEGSVSLMRLIEEAELALVAKQVRMVVEADACDKGEQATCTVHLLDRTCAARLEEGSVEALVLMGLSSAQMPLPSADDLVAELLCALGVELPTDPVAQARAQFAHLVALPKTALLLERSLHSADNNKTYPAVMLSELLRCYGRQELPVASLGEDGVRTLLSAQGSAPKKQATEAVAPEGAIDPGLRRFVSVPQEGRLEVEGGLPVLSASQLESYLECPLKWFSLRRLRLGDVDAGFSPMEMGTFAHRVLELTHECLLDEAMKQAGITSAELMANLARRLPGSGVSMQDEKSLPHARKVLDQFFDVHLEHQRMLQGKRTMYQALIPHSSREEAEIVGLRRDLLSLMDYEYLHFAGFEPRLFEWSFGRGTEQVSYAGVCVTGTVDRVDVDAYGNAIVIDYKHKGPVGFFNEYAALPAGEPESFVLPRRIQSLLYAQVIRRAFPQLKVVAALYLGTKGTHELSGAVGIDDAEFVFGKLDKRRVPRVVVPSATAEELAASDFSGLMRPPSDLEVFLDKTERAIAERVEELRAGKIEARPIDAAACSFCPVLSCPRRMNS